MSQMQPESDDLDYEPRFLPPEPDEMFDDTLWNERAWQPGFRPPGPRPPTGQPWPRPPFGPPSPPPSPGKWPFWGYWGFRMLNAWRDIKFLRRLVADMQTDMLSEAIKDGIVAPGPNSPVPGPGGGAVSGPILGVTDGSDAAAGQVGEFITGGMTGTLNGYPQTFSLMPLILSPGDWDVQAMVDVDDIVWDSFLTLTPVPPGVSGPMSVRLQGWGTVDDTGNRQGGYTATEATLVTPLARANVSVPTLLPFTWMVNQIMSNPTLSGSSMLNPGVNWTFTATARRRR